MTNPSMSENLLRVRNEGRVLVMGSSETGNLGGRLFGKNFWALLNQQKNTRRFAILAGAGRWSYVYLPFILAHRQLLDSMDVLYTLQPYAWSIYNNTFRYDYYKLFNGRALVDSVRFEAKYLDTFDQYIAPYYAGIETEEALDVAPREHQIFGFEDSAVTSQPLLTPEATADLHSEIMRETDPRFNVSYEFLDSADVLDYASFAEKSDFQRQALFRFLQLLHDVGAHVSVLIGPVNALYAEAVSKSAIDPYLAEIEKLMGELTRLGIPTIEGALGLLPLPRLAGITCERCVLLGPNTP